MKSRAYLLFLILLNVCADAFAQVIDPSDTIPQRSMIRRLFDKGVSYLVTDVDDTVMNDESEEQFRDYEGKIIRSISIRQIGFETSIYDSAKKIKKVVAGLADALHRHSNETTIRNHLFVHEGDLLNPFLLADNERFLRDLDFILDSRIVVAPVDASDSVDLVVITRDVMSLGVRLGGSPPSSLEFSLFDANFFGGGQRLQFDGLFDNARTPGFGFGLNFRKSSLLGSLANVEIGYTQLNEGRSYGHENEYAYYLRVDRPLVSPYSRLAGGVEISRNWSENVYQKPDTTFLDYQYTITDTWLGYNIGVHREVDDRRRYFVAARYFNGSYLNPPDQPEYETTPRYNDIKGVLYEGTFYRQNYYKTRYVLGFGRTEDVPYGIRTSVALGYLTISEITRPYAAYKLRYSAANKKGGFYNIGFQAGSFLNGKDAFEDATIDVRARYFTKAFSLRRYKLRVGLAAGLTRLVNRYTGEPLKVTRNEIYGFSADSLFGTRRLSLRSQVVLYTPWQLLGFRFAPFAATDWARLDCPDSKCGINDIIGLSAGFRTRNENLIFGTIEVRGTYVPDNGFGESDFYLEVRQNLRIKNTGQFAGPPLPVIPGR